MPGKLKEEAWQRRKLTSNKYSFCFGVVWRSQIITNQRIRSPQYKLPIIPSEPSEVEEKQSPTISGAVFQIVANASHLAGPRGLRHRLPRVAMHNLNHTQVGATNLHDVLRLGAFGLIRSPSPYRRCHGDGGQEHVFGRIWTSIRYMVYSIIIPHPWFTSVEEAVKWWNV